MSLKTVMALLLLTLCSVSVAATPPTGMPAGGASMPSLAPMVAETSPAVVNIATYTHVVNQSPLMNDPFFRRFFNVPQAGPHRSKRPRAVAAGSGVIVDENKGYVLTNAHVVRGADDIKVTLQDGSTLKAKLVGQDKQVDLAVLQVKSDDLTQINFAKADSLKVGDYVVAIGNPFALGQTVTSGIVSALGRAGLGIEGYENFIQTDASINPGNSGGALVNLQGELVGMPTAILAPTGGNVGIGFAIPISMISHVMNQLIEHGKVERAVLGVSIQTVTSNLAQALGLNKGQKGVVVSQVMPKSAAEAAGLKAGDVITAVDGKRITSASQLSNRVGLAPVGQSITLGVLRDGKETSIKATLRKQAATTQNEAQPNTDSLDSRLQGATFSTVESGQLSYADKGVLIDGVQRGSAAQRAGLQPGDVIVSANHQRVVDIKSFTAALKEKSESLLLRINRRGGIFFLVIR